MAKRPVAVAGGLGVVVGDERGHGLEVGHDAGDLDPRRVEAAAAQLHEVGGPLHPFGQQVDVDVVAVELVEDLLELLHRLGVPEVVEVGGGVGRLRRHRAGPLRGRRRPPCW